jgi:iron complex transport system ATP-binding protein
MSADSEILKASNISHAIGRKFLVAEASLRLKSGELVVAIGPNGAGKSTLLRMLTGELRCGGGDLRYDDIDIDALPAWSLAARRAVMAQSTRVAFDFLVYEIVSLGVEAVGRKQRRAVRHEMIAAALAYADVSHLAHRVFGSLSGGEQQRVQFARSLCQILSGRAMNFGQILFMDEPTAHLDMTHQLMLMGHARELSRTGIAVFVTLHDLNLAAAYADRLIVLNGGRVTAQGRPGEVLTSALLAEVFSIDSGMSELPPLSSPFFLPHKHAQMVKAPRNSVLHSR